MWLKLLDRCPCLDQHNTILNLFQELVDGGSRDSKGTSPFFLDWRIWKMRNNLIFENKRDHIVQTIKAAWLDKRLWDEAMEYDPLDVHVAHTTSQSHTSHDLLPEAELYRIADASCKSPTDKVGIEWSLTNKEGILKLQGNAAVEATNSDSDTKMLCS
ncbi:hypothetical protein F2Q70_00025632 [Brassica cretica]|uniref:Uncharacterized protein n=1 Tax=Brassica cretica TaxID=69181 RepID=A0A8S9QYI8_BRACR|nr:hypothetical protein F2Q70_00025632 [Brassica cretica]KAF3556597.1 hypothetical protein F2Q69_00012277 [Brassica cretica]